MSDIQTPPPAKQDQGALPTVDDLLGKPQSNAVAGNLPTADEILGPAPGWGFKNSILSGPGWDDYVQQAPLGRILNAFGQGAAQGWGNSSLGFDPQTEEWLKKVGIFNDVTKGQHSIIRSFNEGVMRPAAAVADFLWRAPNALFSGATEAGNAAGAEVGIPDLGNDIAAIPQAMGFSPLSEFTGVPRPPSPATIHAFRAGENDAVFFGTQPPAALSPEATADLVRHQQEEAANANQLGTLPSTYAPNALGERPTEAPIAPRTETQVPPANVHEAARRIAPQTFADYDNLTSQQETLRGKITDAQTELQRNAEAQAPGQARIEELQSRLDAGTTTRLAKKYQDELDDLIPKRDAFLESDQFAMLTRPTAEIDQMRDQLQRIDYRMRDLAPDVTAAYRQAAPMFPAPEEPAPAAQAAPAPEQPAAPEHAAAPEQPPEPEAAPAAPQPPQEAPAPEQPPARVIPASVAADVSQKLVAAGRPQAEADAAGAVLNAYYETRAARFGGAKGTPQELYAAEGPEIRAAEKGGRGGAATGKARIQDGRTIITLFRRADASTFVHETGHQWLEDLLKDSRDTAAPDQLRADAGAVRQWLGAEPDAEITTAQHERFARGFERYMMEGVAPTRALDRVFAQFRDWLTKIYETVKGLRAPISDDIRDVFDRMLAKQVEPATIAPEPSREFVTEPTAKPLRAAKVSPYERLPQEPTRLIDWLRRPTVQFKGTVNETTIPGGLKDEGGDIAAIIGGSKGRPGLINNKTGRALDEATEAAWEAGYLPGDQRPDINALKDAIREDHNGNPVYSEHDLDAVAAYQQAQETNREIDRLAAEHGIDTNGLTREQFFDAVAAKLSEATLEDEIRNYEEKHEHLFDIVEAEAREEGEAPDTYGEPRTLEDLENAYRQEATARAASTGAGNLGELEPAAGRAEYGEGGGGPRGSGTGPSGRPGEEAGAPGGGAETARRSAEPTTAAQPYPGSELRFVDKAGNIRLELLTDDATARQALREEAGQSGDFMDARRGVVSDAQVLDMADSINATAGQLNIEKLRQMSVEDDLPMAARIKAGRKMLLQAEAAVREAAASGNVEAFVMAGERLNMIQATISGITAEWGRAGRAFRNMTAETEGARDVGAIVQEATGRTLFQIKKQMQQVMNLETPGQVSKFARDAANPGLADWVQSAFVNALLSGPFTHAGYTVAGELYALFRGAVEGGIASTIGAIRDALNVGPRDRAHFAEVPHELYGLYRGAINGAKASWKAFKANEPVLPSDFEKAEMPEGTLPVGMHGVIPNPEIGGVKVPIGTILESPSRLVTALHTYNWTTFYNASKSQQAAHIAIEEGLTGQRLADRIAALEMNPTPEIMEKAAQDASSGALMKRTPYSSLMGIVGRLTNYGWQFGDLPLPGGRSIPLGTLRPLKFIDPFVQIAANVQRAALGRGTPLALFSQEVRDDLMMRNGGEAFDRTAGKIIAGTGLMIGFGGLAAKGLMNPSGPTDPHQMALWRRIYGQPHGLHVGDLTFNMLRLGPLGMQASVAADLYHVAHQLTQDDAAKVAADAVHAVSQNILDESFMRGPAELMQAVEDSNRYGAAWVRNFVSAAVPFSVGLGQVAREIDPYSRQARTTMDAILAKLPFESEKLFPRYDVWGQPIPTSGWAGTYYDRPLNDPTDRVLDRLGIYPGQPKRTIRGVQLTDAQYDEYARTRGRMAKQRVDVLVNTPGFSLQPPLIQVQSIRAVMESATTQAEALVMAHSYGTKDDIVRKAIEAKQAQLIPGH